MKYIKKREEFLQYRIYEAFDMSGGSGGGGPMYNDITWGDSLVGRLFNSVFRKVGVQIDVLNMNGVLKQIRRAFDDLYTESKLDNSGVEKTDIDKLKISYMLEALTKAVHSGTKVSALKDLTNETINTAKNSDLEDKENLLRQLDAFLEFLDTLNEDETVGEDIPAELTGIKEDDISDDKSTWEKNKVYGGMISILINLKGVLDNSTKVISAQDSDINKKDESKNLKYIYDEILIKLKPKSINKDFVAMFFYIDGNSIYFRNKKLVSFQGKYFIPYIKKWSKREGRYTGNTKPLLSEFNDKVVANFANYVIYALDNMVVKTVLPHEKEWLNNNMVGKWVYNNKGVCYRIEMVNSDNATFDCKNRHRYYKGNVIAESPKEILKFSIGKLITCHIANTEDESKNYIEKAHKELRDKFTGSGKDLSDIKQGRNLNESLVVKDDMTIKALETIKSVIDDIKKPVSKISVNSETIGYIISLKREKVSEIKKLLFEVKTQYNKKESIYESIDISNENNRVIVAKKIAKFAKKSMLLIGEDIYDKFGEMGRYLERFNNDFNRLLNQDLDEFLKESYIILNEDVASDIKSKVINWYDENVDYNEWVVKQSDVNEVDDKTKNAPPKNVNIDKMVEIVKLCNRAYKIHTKEVIPSGRSGGKVSNRVFREYEYVGQSSPSARLDDKGGGVLPGIGPYRNKKAFNVFENGMLDIIKDKKYQRLFTENTTIKDDRGEIKKGNGKILLKFIMALIDGKNLYKSGEQEKFFSEYFNYDIPKNSGFYSDSSFSKKSKKDDEKKDKALDLYLKGVSSMTKETRTIYCCNIDGGKDIYIMILSKDTENVYFKYSASIKAFEVYLKTKIKRGDMVSEPLSDNSKIFFASADVYDFPFKVGDTINIDLVDIMSVNDGSPSVSKDVKIKINSFMAVYDKDSDKQFVLNASEKTSTGMNNDSNDYKKLTDALK